MQYCTYTLGKRPRPGKDSPSFESGPGRPPAGGSKLLAHTTWADPTCGTAGKGASWPGGHRLRAHFDCGRHQRGGGGIDCSGAESGQRRGLKRPAGTQGFASMPSLSRCIAAGPSVTRSSATSRRAASASLRKCVRARSKERGRAPVPLFVTQPLEDPLLKQLSMLGFFEQARPVPHDLTPRHGLDRCQLSITHHRCRVESPNARALPASASHRRNSSDFRRAANRRLVS